MDLIDHIVIDAEIQKTIEETPGGWDATDRLGISAVCLWEYETQRMRVYGPNEVQELQERILDADRITGFNIWRFDLPLIWGFTREEWMNPPAESRVRPIQFLLKPKIDDLLRRAWRALNLNPDDFTEAHKGWSLNNIVRSTLGQSKIGTGPGAPQWFQQGFVHKVINYCADDVSLERDLCDYIDRYGRVLNGDRVLQIPPWFGLKKERE